MSYSRWNANARGSRLGRIVLAPGILALGLLLAPMISSGASAQLGPCRTDPYILLSNGYKVDLLATIGDKASDVQQVTFTLHGPSGTQVAKVGSDPSLAKVETFAYYADDKAKTYDVDTYVSTGQSGVSVTSATTLIDAKGHKVDAKTATGVTKKHLQTHMSG